MAIIGLARLADISKMLGICPMTADRWCRKLGIPVVKAPVGEHGDGKGSPRFISVEGGAMLIDRMLPGLVSRVDRKRLLKKMRRDSARRQLQCQHVRQRVVPSAPC